jgi:hypothetical protein
MSNSLAQPFPMYFDVDGKPIEDGRLYVGVAGLNPLSNPQAAFWDGALTIPASDIRISGGVPVYNGAPSRIYVSGDYSFLVQDKNGKTIYSKLNGYLENADWFVSPPRGNLGRAARVPDSFNFNLIVDTGFYSWSNAATTNFPPLATASDLFLLSVVSSPDGAGIITQRAANFTMGFTSADFETSRASDDGGTTWTAWTSISSSNQKNIIEKSKRVGEIYTLLDQLDPSVWDEANPDAYLPALCLTSIETQVDLDVANWIDLVPWLRTKKSIFKDGVTGEISSPGVTNWAISANVGTLTFTNNADHILFLAALLEDEVMHGSYAAWRTITLISAIGNITAGTYAITNVNASSRTVSFAFVAGDASGGVVATAEFYAFRIAGSTTTARVWTARGLSLMGANDLFGYFVSGALRRRGFFESHHHSFKKPDGTVADFINVYNTAGASTFVIAAGNGGTGLVGSLLVNAPITDGVNTLRSAKETHSPAITVHIYLHGGRFI